MGAGGEGARVSVFGPTHGEPVIIAPAAAGTLPGQEQANRRRDVAPVSGLRLIQVEKVVQEIGRPERVHPCGVDALDLADKPGGWRSAARRARAPRSASSRVPQRWSDRATSAVIAAR